MYQKDRYSIYDVFKREVRKTGAYIRPEEKPETKKASKAAVQPEKSEMSEIKQLLKQMNERIDIIEKDKQQQQQPYYYPRDQGFRGSFRGSFGGRSRGRGSGFAAPPPRGRGEYKPSRPVGRRMFEPTCYYCNEKGHIQRNCPANNQPLCYSCQEPGHFSRDCPNR